MKIRISAKTQKSRGAALLVAVLFFVFTAVFLATYLILTQGEYTSVARSQTWNSSMVLAEAGVEDGMALINKYADQNGSLSNWANVATADGWAKIVDTASNQVFYLAKRSPDPNLGYYSVYVTNFLSGTNPGPTILSIGTAKWNSSSATFQNQNPIRKVYVQTYGASQLGGGMIALSTMDFNGNGVWIDSFDSTSPLHSIWQTNWLFHGKAYGIWSSSLSIYSNTLPSRTADVVVATDASIINVGNANIAGYVDTAPGGTSGVGNNGSVGDLTWALVNQARGIQPGHAKDDMNRTFYSKPLPVPTNNLTGQLTWWPVPSPTNVIRIGGWYSNSVCYGGSLYTNVSGGYTIGGIKYSQVITNRPHTNSVFYAMIQLTGNLFIDGQDVVLYLTNGLSLSGSSVFTLNTNADVQLYSTGNISTSGNGSINNYGYNAHALAIYDVAGHGLTINLGGNGQGTGYIYAPSSSLKFAGGGNSSYDVVGAIFCHDIQINGHYNFHFDTSLAPVLPADQFFVINWQELR